jgi:hypothetical protein
MEPSHWAWQRQRPVHHVGALRTYCRDADFYDVRGPHQTPRGPCDQCTAAIIGTDGSSCEDSSDISWYLSSSSSPSSSEADLLTFVNSKGQLNVLSKANDRRFNKDGKMSSSKYVLILFKNATLIHLSRC